MLKIQSLTTCTGCSACYSICSKSAISMSENDEGFLYPQIDASKCIGCKKCEKVCPVLNPLEPTQSLKESYAFANNNESIRYESSSGGVFSALTKKLFDDGGEDTFVFGAGYSDDLKSVIHSLTNDYNTIQIFRGSKYTQSNINDSFKDCKNLLESGKTVCFSGTPCQIGGLKKYLGRDYDNLFTVDFICHGVPSPMLWRKYVEYREGIAGAKATRTSSRRKNDGWKKYSLWFAFANHNEYCQDLTKDPYMQMFLKNVCLRKSCYGCKFKTLDRQSDITMADFWGIQEEYPELDDDKGISFVVIHSEKGKKLFDSLTDCMKQPVPLESGLKHNPSMVRSVELPTQRKVFFKDLNTLSFEKVIKKYASTPWYVKGYRLVRRCIGKVLRKVGLKK